MSEFRMPALGADMTSGTLLEWLVKPGEEVKRGDIVAVVDTSKAEIEVEIFEDGVIGELLVAEGTRVPVGTPLATVLAAAPATAASVAVAATPQSPAAAAPPSPIVGAPEPPTVGAPEPPTVGAPEPPTVAARVPSMPPAPVALAPAEAPAPSLPAPERRSRVSPLARRLAERLGVDLGTVTGSGPGGAITKDDVERAGRAAGEPADRHAAMREAIGALMARSKREIPHYYLQTQIDLRAALGWLGEQNLERPVSARLLPATLLLSAVAKAAARTPAMNGFWIDGAFRPAEDVHLGVAISLRGGGLIAPALRDADRMSLDELMAALGDLVQRARSGRLRATEMSDPTITVTNLGERGADLVHGVIYPPQVALVGFGGIRERPLAVDGMIGAHPTVYATLAADHRAGDGHAGSRFLASIDRLLQKPEEL